MTAPFKTPVQAVAWACHATTTIKDAEGTVLAESMGQGRYSDEDEAIAREIVRRINVHDELVALAQRAEALLAGQKWLPEGSDPESVLLRDLRAAIAAATGGAS